jgi:hypothetical protein
MKGIVGCVLMAAISGLAARAAQPPSTLARAASELKQKKGIDVEGEKERLWHVSPPNEALAKQLTLGNPHALLDDLITKRIPIGNGSKKRTVVLFPNNSPTISAKLVAIYPGWGVALSGKFGVVKVGSFHLKPGDLAYVQKVVEERGISTNPSETK